MPLQSLKNQFGIATKSGILALSLIATSYIKAQSLSFEVASIRPDPPGGMFNMVHMNFEPDGYSASHATVWMLLKDAYGIDNYQIFAAPSWVHSDRYEIEAKIDSAASEQLAHLKPDQLKLAHQQMLRSLLADRFKLTAHIETRELPVYSLVIAKNGPKIHEAKPDDTYANGLKSATGNTVGPHMMLMQLRGGHVSGQIDGQGVPLELLVQQLAAQVGRTVIDKTGLTGSYDFNLTWTPDPPTPEAATAEPAAPSLFTAIQEQLGLKLESTKGPVQVLVIDHIEPLSEN